jgi:hypothetical protein
MIIIRLEGMVEALAAVKNVVSIIGADLAGGPVAVVPTTATTVAGTTMIRFTTVVSRRLLRDSVCRGLNLMRIPLSADMAICHVWECKRLTFRWIFEHI